MPARTRTRWTRWLIGGVLAAVVLVVGVPFVYINFINGEQPAPLAVPTSAAAAPTGSTVDGAWTIGAGSQAGYRVHEILAGQPTDAVGRTSGVTGNATISGTTVTSGAVTVDLTTVASNESRRDNQFTGAIMDTDRFPTASFTLDAPVDLDAAFLTGAPATATATGTLTMHGVSRQVSVPLTATRNGAAIDVAGSIPVTFADFGIDTPSIAGFVTVDPTGQVEFLVKLAA